MNPESKIYVAGHLGLVGSALMRRLRGLGYANLVHRTRDEMDLEDPHAVRAFFEQERPEYVFLAAARVGGIWANDTYPADFIRSNLVIQLNVVDAAWRTGVQKLVFLGSSCIYPRHAPQPIREEYLLSGPLEPTNEPYAVAKIAGIKLCQSYNRQYGTRFVSVMPTNLYGPGDNFDPSSSHVIPALIKKCVDARDNGADHIEVWGTGAASREFLYVDDAAEGIVLGTERYDGPEPVNLGVGQEITIRDLVSLIVRLTGYGGEVRWDETKPDGQPRRALDTSRARALFGFEAKTSFEVGLRRTIDWYEQHRVS